MSGAARWLRATATPGFIATASKLGDLAGSPRRPAPSGWWSAASCRRSTAISIAGARCSKRCGPSSEASWSTRPTGTTTRTRRSSIWSTRTAISGYFNLRDAKAPDDDATAEAGWRRVRQELEAWRVGRSAPFIFTELGYRSRAGATAAPWDEGPGGAPDPDEQRRGFAAFRRAWTGVADPRRRLHLELVRLRRPRHHQLHPPRQARRGRSPSAPRESLRPRAASDLLRIHRAGGDERADRGEGRQRQGQIHRPALAHAVATGGEDERDRPAAAMRDSRQARVGTDGPHQPQDRRQIEIVEPVSPLGAPSRPR